MGGREGGRECRVLPESNPSAWRLRTENLFSTSGVTLPNYPLKVPPQSSHTRLLLSASVTLSLFLFLPPSLSLYVCVYIYFFSILACHPSSDSDSISSSLPPCLCPPLFISVCLSIPVSLSHFLSPPPRPYSFLVFLQFKVLWTSWASHHSQTQDGSAMLVLTACPQMLPGFSGIYVQLCPSPSELFG